MMIQVVGSISMMVVAAVLTVEVVVAVPVLFMGMV